MKEIREKFLDVSSSCISSCINTVAKFSLRLNDTKRDSRTTILYMQAHMHTDQHIALHNDTSYCHRNQ